MTKIKKRSEQRREDTWDLEAIYQKNSDWEEDAACLEQQLEEFGSLKGRLGESSASMLQIMETYCRINELTWKLYAYASMRLDEDTTDSYYQQMESKARTLAIRLGTECAWVEPEILEMDREKLESFLAENYKLRLYRIYLEEIQRRKEHTLSDETERLLAQASRLGQAPYQVYSMFQNADLTFEPVKGADGEMMPLTQETFVALEQNSDREIRSAAFAQFYREYVRFGNTLAALFEANVQQELFFARQRNYGSSLEMELDDAQIPVSVYHQLIGTVHDNLPSMHRYVTLRKKLLGVEELHMYDVYVPMTGAVQKTYTFEEAKQMVLEGLRPQGEEYLSILKKGMDSRWIDVYENEGKRSGAYSGGSYLTAPYVLMNYQGTLNHVFTLAHELGHSVHSYYTRHTQPYIYGDYKIFVAEVASTCNEALLIRSLLQKTSDRQERAYLVNYFLEQFKGTLFRQTMFAEFELITHERAARGESLNAEALCGIYLDLNRKYFGDEMVSDPEIAWEWARIPHFYRPFYVYQYATGFSAAIAIAEKIWKGEPQAVENYRKFLCGGSSMSPIELLKLCGVDMTSPAPVQDALDLFAEYLGEMEKSTE